MKYNGWKVILKENRQSISNWHGQNPFVVEYPVNVEVFPKKGKLFFFKTKKNAIKFLKMGKDSFIIVKCVATNPQKFNEPLAMCGEDIIAYWELKLCAKSNSPEGTYTADSITCLE